MKISNWKDVANCILSILDNDLLVCDYLEAE